MGGIRPRVLILATGGTISGEADDRSVMAYNAGAVSGEALSAAVPGLRKLALLKVEQISNIASQNMNAQIWFHLAERIESAVEADEVDAIVITHGTDTMEETAFFLSCVLTSRKPVIMTGAMRPSTAISADGPSNLYQAVKVASAPVSQGRGVMIVMNGVIHSARRVVKTDTTSLQTFQSRNGGEIGFVDMADVRFLERPPVIRPFPLPTENKLPDVRIIYAYAGMDACQIDEAINAGVVGLVIAGMGDGNMPDMVLERLDRAVEAGIIVVRSSRVERGFVHRNIEIDDDKHKFIVSCDLGPQKARILLQLLICGHVKDKVTIQHAFEP
ncbi:asparaginase [Acetobacteraceae bacterium ESL0709]|nr:asparaginase [Acetobacteraceae bacterium ESL0697]MDF7678918.1 asparaginase [Acetobacteraceae bacterium ESL0709]